MRQRKSAHRLRQALGEAVHAADERDHPEVVADADAAVRVTVGPDRRRRHGRHVRELGLVTVLEHLPEVRLQVVDVHVLARRDRARRMPDRHAVLDHVLAFRDVPAGVLVPVLANLHVVQRINDHNASRSPRSRGSSPRAACRSGGSSRRRPAGTASSTSRSC